MTFPAEQIFTGGQMTDLPSFTGSTFDGTELFEVVAPGSAALGVNYSITSTLLASLLNKFISNTPTIITSGATIGSPYAVLSTDTRVLFNKAVGAASYALLATSSTYPVSILFKDLKGDAATNNITIEFSGGELCDGQPTVVINTNYGFVSLTPLAAGGFYVSGGG